MAQTNSWFRVGVEGEERARQLEEKRLKQYGIDGIKKRAFYLKPGNTARITFLDGEGFYFLVHSMKLDGKWGHLETCLRDFSECPLCESGQTATYVAAYTIIYNTKYVSEATGKTYVNTKRLFLAKKGVRARLAKRKEDHPELQNDLTFGLFSITRHQEKESNTGEDIIFLKKLTKADLLKFKPEDQTEEEWLAPFDYMTVFEPKSVEELRRMVGQAPPLDGDSDTPPWVAPNAAVISDASIESLL